MKIKLMKTVLLTFHGVRILPKILKYIIKPFCLLIFLFSGNEQLDKVTCSDVIRFT